MAVEPTNMNEEKDEYESWLAYHDKLYKDAGVLGPIADQIIADLRIPECLELYSKMVIIRNLKVAYNCGLADQK